MDLDGIVMVQVVVDILVVVKTLLQPTSQVHAVPGGGSPSSEYYVYILGATGGEGNGSQGNYRSLGGQSYVNPVATSYSDLGYHGPHQEVLTLIVVRLVDK